MISKIKQLADEAIKLQNKNRMDEVLREISAMCSAETKAKIFSESMKKQVPAEDGLTHVKYSENKIEKLKSIEIEGVKAQSKGGKK